MTLQLDPPRLESLSASPQPVWCFDIERGRIAWANQAGVELWGANDLGSLVRQDFRTWLGRESCRQLQAYLDAVREGGELEEQLTIYPRGEPITLVCRYSGVRMDDGRHAVLVEGRVRMIEAATLRAVEALNATNVMFSLLDFDGHTRFENPAALRTHGFTRPSASTRHGFTSRFVDEDAARDAWERLGADEVFEAEVLVKTRGGQRWHEVFADTTTDPVTGERVVLMKEHDITERRRLQQRMQMNERMASIGELAGGLAHEINNPLAYVLMNVELLEELGTDGLRDVDEGELRTMLTDLREGVDRIRSTVFDLGELARVDSGDLTPVDIQSVLETSIAMTHARLKQRAQVVRDFGDVPLVAGRRARLGQVFVNVLINAVQALEEHGREGRITLVTRSSEDRKRVYVEIRDTGPGVPEERLGQIFDPFYTTRPAGRGSGLGLSVVRHIVADHGGEIVARPNPGGGLIIRIELPATKELRIEKTSAHGARSMAGVRRVLVIDDEPGIRRALARLLDEHVVDTAVSGAEALSLIARNPYDVIFCDIMMPVMDGMALYEALEADGRGIEKRIVFITAGAFTERTANFLERVPNATVHKPFNRELVRGVVERS